MRKEPKIDRIRCGLGCVNSNMPLSWVPFHATYSFSSRTVARDEILKMLFITFFASTCKIRFERGLLIKTRIKMWGYKSST